MELFDRFVQVIINPSLLLLAGLSVLMFLFGLFRFVNASRSGASNMSEGKQHMIYGLIGLFVIFAVAGIINTIAATLGVPRAASGTTPGSASSDIPTPNVPQSN